LSLIFSALGYRVRSGEDGFSALAEIQNEIPDVLLADVNMARMPGMEFLAAVRRSFPSVRVIAMTGVFSGNRARPDIAADAFYQKGAGPSRLIATAACGQPSEHGEIVCATGIRAHPCTSRRHGTRASWQSRLGAYPSKK
jgi:CheY-like chemotaxis protein